MGGKVFSAGKNPLYTPRMALAVYDHVKKQCISALKILFPRVESPIQAPEKTSFGDVDILVSLEGSSYSRTLFTDPTAWTPIQKALCGVCDDYEARAGADRRKIVDAMSIAIPWPADLSADARAAQTLVEAGQADAAVASNARVGEGGGTGEAEDGGSVDRYVQVDVRLCDNDKELEWRMFKHNHGDLWNVLGHIIRPFGLTADETSLSIRIPEIEKENRKLCRVFLTDSPTETLDFLGLSHQNGELERPFESVDALFEYAASCKWFMIWPGKKKDAEEKAPTHDTTSTAAAKAAKAAKDDSTYLRKLKQTDSARMRQRPLFARWAEDFQPRCREQGRFPAADPDTRTPLAVRDEVRLLAFNTFPGSGPAYAATLAAWKRDKVRDYVRTTVIRGDMCLPADVVRALPAPQHGADAAELERNWRGVLRSALVRILVWDDAGFEGVEPPRLRDEEGCLVVEDVKDWIVRNWEEVGRVAWKVQCEKARAKMEEVRKLAEAAAAATAAEGDIADDGEHNA